MNDTIKVGDRVETRNSHRTGCVQGIYHDQAWILLDSDEMETLHLSVLTRIEPEPVVLTPKYAIGQNVTIKGAGRAGEQTVYRIAEVADTIRYALEWDASPLGSISAGRTLATYTADQLEPVPEPCPECKGSGVASE
jgi:hypothetical protein